MFAHLRKKSVVAREWQAIFLSGSEKINPTIKHSAWVLTGMVWIFAVVLLARLFELQIVQGSYHLLRAEENRLVTHRLAAGRGIIRDRNGEALTRNVPTYKRLLPGTVLAQSQFETIDRTAAIGLSEAGQWVFFDISRDYLAGRPLAPILGYVGDVETNEQAAIANKIIGDLEGKTGVEASRDEYLRGQPGFEYVEVNAKGETIQTEERIEPVNGKDITLTIDRDLQDTMYEALDGYTGAAVAIEPSTGKILGLVSRPVFDPNNIAGSLSEPNEPFFNRAISGAYPPGSIYKMVTLTAALEEGAVTAGQQVEDTGKITVNDFQFANWLFERSGGTEGLVDAVKAMQRSNDIYFYKVGEWLGPIKLAEWSRFFGLGSKTGIDLPGEATGLIPDPVWKERTTGDRWYLGNTYHMAIGQGDVLVTPLQMALVTGVIANNGRWCRPTMVAGDAMECKELGITLEHLAVVREGMKAVCQPGGTAARWGTFLPTVACKTGTAQYGGADSTKTHAWFTVFAPADNPTIVLTILLEGAGEGSEFASPVAMKILSSWFANNP